MCWNLEISLVAAFYGFSMCYYFYNRNYSTRDPWYALFLGSFTCTQLLDAFFWSLSTEDDPQKGLPVSLVCDSTNYWFTKFGVTPVLFSQVLCITVFPEGTANDWLKPYVRYFVLFIIALVALIAECTTVLQTTGGYMPGPTLVYWGFMPPWWLFLGGVAVWSVPALLFIYPTVYATNILAVGGLNLAILQVLDGTIFLVSKLCFYCLQLSILWYFEPQWAPPGDRTSVPCTPVPPNEEVVKHFPSRKEPFLEHVV